MVATTILLYGLTFLLARQNFMNSLVLGLIGRAGAALSDALDHTIYHVIVGSFDT